jgi:hypothetical protein
MHIDENNNPLPPVAPIKLELSTEELQAQETARLAAEAEAKRVADEQAANNGGGNKDNANVNTNSIIFENEDGTEITYKLNEAGDALNEDGTVFKTKDEITTLSTTADDSTISINDIAKVSGIKLVDDKGSELEFEATVEGFAKREVAIAEEYQNVGYNQAIDDLYAAHPEIPVLLQHKQLYGNLDNFGKAIKYQEVTIEADNKELHKNLIIEAEVARGRDVKSATKVAEMYIADGSSLEEAKLAHKYLVDTQKKIDDEQVKLIADKEYALQRKAEDYYGVKFENNKLVPLNVEDSIYDKIISKGQIGKFKIPETGVTIKQDGKVVKLSRADLFNHLAIVDSELGTTRAAALEQAYFKNKDNYLLHHLRVLLGYDFNQLIEDAANVKLHQAVKELNLNQLLQLTHNKLVK